MKIAETCRCGAAIEIDSSIPLDVKEHLREWRAKHEGHNTPSEQRAGTSSLGTTIAATAPKSTHPMGFTPDRPYG